MAITAKLKAKPKAKTSGSNTEHALLSPSSAKKWMGCPASLTVEKGIPNTSGAAAEAGTAVHHVSEIIINEYLRDETVIPATKFIGGTPLATAMRPSKVVFTDEMAKQAQAWADYVIQLIDSGWDVKVEMRSELSKILNAPDTFGTADLVAVTERTSGDGTHMLMVGDLKTGRHKVDVKNNFQMMLYALGILRKYRFIYDITVVRLVIFQPLAGGVSEWDISPEDLDAFAAKAKTAAGLALACYAKGKKKLVAADFIASADACQWCRFAEQCNAKTKMANATMNADLADTPSGIEMTLEELADAYNKLPQLRQHIATIEKAVYSRMINGDKVPGYKLVEGKGGARAWDEAATLSAIIKVIGTNNAGAIAQKLVMLSPTELEKAVPAATWLKLNKFVTRKPGSPAIAPEDDKRDEYNPVKDADLED